MTSTDEILDLEVERDMDIEGGNKISVRSFYILAELVQPWGI